jgi:hypothetical protein
VSLDVYLQYDSVKRQCPTCMGAGILSEDDEVYSANITHNLGKMAEEAGLYVVLWRPEENGITHARQLIEPLRAGLAKLKAEPERFKRFDAPNGWGLYENFVPWVERYLEACEHDPHARVHVSR